MHNFVDNCRPDQMGPYTFAPSGVAGGLLHSQMGLIAQQPPPTIPYLLQQYQQQNTHHQHTHAHHPQPHSDSAPADDVALDLTATRRPVASSTTSAMRKTPSPYNGSNFSDLSPGDNNNAVSQEVPEVKYDPRHGQFTMFQTQQPPIVQRTLQDQIKQQYPSPNESVHEPRAMPTVYATTNPPPAVDQSSVLNSALHANAVAQSTKTAAYASAGYMMPMPPHASLSMMHQIMMRDQHMAAAQTQQQHQQLQAALVCAAAVAANNVAQLSMTTSPDMGAQQLIPSARSSANTTPNPAYAATAAAAAAAIEGEIHAAASRSGSCTSNSSMSSTTSDHHKSANSPSESTTSTTTRPFKVLPRDPQAIAAQFTAKDAAHNAKKYVKFRKRMLEEIHSSHGGNPTVSNPKMRRTKAPAKPDAVATGVVGTMHRADSESEASNCATGAENGAAASSSGGGAIVKDAAYLERRQKNNAAAKKSRDRRRIKEDEITIRNAFLDNENNQLQTFVDMLEAQLEANNIVPCTVGLLKKNFMEQED